MDEEGTKIQAIVFNDVADVLQQSLQKDKTYLISTRLVKPVNPQFDSAHKRFELTFSSGTQVKELETNIDIAQLRLQFVSFKDLKHHIEHNDIIGIISLSTLSITTLHINPALPKVEALKAWYMLKLTVGDGVRNYGLSYIFLVKIDKKSDRIGQRLIAEEVHRDTDGVSLKGTKGIIDLENMTSTLQNDNTSLKNQKLKAIKEGEQYAKENGMLFFETSAKAAHNTIVFKYGANCGSQRSLKHILMYHGDKVWEHPKEWRPERFLDENNDSVDLYKMMAFGGGKRVCAVGALQTMPISRMAIGIFIQEFDS
ncbi:hypothetical protein RJ639_015478 [Escallonia herrerae]|uniref:Uncharacterized protein n=1 Tax=Escallonia herrerae TaxID=1293975 RepID=A0AA88VDY5_9ASTE|nr:hypothetical protein RJ639_015478 [Escallonia herrerae]